jgi:hypothetical protein
MRPEDFSDRLRRGAGDIAARTDPVPAEAVRRRGDRRRRRNMAASGLLAFAIGAGGGGYAYASFTTTASSNTPVSGTSASAPAIANGTGRPSIVAVTTAGVVEVLNPKTGLAIKTLSGMQDAVGDEIAVTRSTVYFAVHPQNSCTDEIESVPLAGGTPDNVTTGVLPAISPNGSYLAFVREQTGGGVTPVRFGCGSSSGVEVVILDLATHAQTVYRAPPGQAAPVSHLSWSPDNKMLLVSSGPVQDNQGWELNRLNVSSATYYVPDATSAASKRYLPAGTAQPPGSYYEEGVYQPDGNLFVDEMCCQGTPAKTTSDVLQVVNGSGTEVRQVAIGDLTAVHSSLDAIPGWLLYLSGTDLFIAADGWQAPKTLSAFGFIAAAWVP